MNTKVQIAFGLSLISVLQGGVALAQSGTSAIKLSPAAQRILCERFPLNSRCPGGSSVSAAPASGSAPAAPATTGATKTIAAIAAENSSFKTLNAALKAAGLTSVLEGNGPFTVFAPTDAAFAALPAGTVENLLKPENKAKLTKVLTYHALSQKALSSNLTSTDVATIEGSSIKVTVAPTGVTVNNAKVVQADIMAKNGVIHVIDQVLLPPNL